MDTRSRETRAADFTKGDFGDVPMLPLQLDQSPPEREIATVTANGAFDAGKCHDAMAARGVAANIPPGRNANPGSPTPPRRSA